MINAHFRRTNRLLPLVITLCVALMGVTTQSAHANINVVNGLTQRFSVSLGEQYRGSVRLENTSDAAASVAIYKADYYFSAEDGTIYGQPGTLPRSNAPWLQLGSSPVVIPPNDTLNVPFEFGVPNAENVSGTYWSVIMVEPLVDPTQQATETNEDESRMNLGIAQRLRYAVQVITDVGEVGSPNIVPENPKLGRSEDGSHVFEVDLINTGTRWVVPSVRMEVYSETGGHVGQYEGQMRRIFPETSVRERIFLGKLKPGKYQAVLIADGGGSAVFGARYSFAVSPSTE